MRRRNLNPPRRRVPSFFFPRGAQLSNYDNFTDEQLDLELARSDQLPPSFDIRTALNFHSFYPILGRSRSSPAPPFSAGDGPDLRNPASNLPPPLPAGDATNLGMETSLAPPPLPTGDDPDSSDDNFESSIEHPRWTNDGGGRSLLYLVAENLSSNLGMVAAGSPLAAACATFIPANVKDTASQLSDSEALTLAAEILKRPLSSSYAGRVETAKRINCIMGHEED